MFILNLLAVAPCPPAAGMDDLLGRAAARALRAANASSSAYHYTEPDTDNAASSTGPAADAALTSAADMSVPGHASSSKGSSGRGGDNGKIQLTEDLVQGVEQLSVQMSSAAETVLANWESGTEEVEAVLPVYEQPRQVGWHLTHIQPRHALTPLPCWCTASATNDTSSLEGSHDHSHVTKGKRFEQLSWHVHMPLLRRLSRTPPSACLPRWARPLPPHPTQAVAGVPLLQAQHCWRSLQAGQACRVCCMRLHGRWWRGVLGAGGWGSLIAGGWHR